MPRRVAPTQHLRDLSRAQQGVLSRRQVLRLGLSHNYIATQLAARRWRPARPGVYFTFTGHASFEAHVWAGVLYGGDGAVASGETAAYLCGLTDRAPSYVEISVDARRRVDGQRGHDDIPPLRVRRVLHLPRRRHPSRLPPQTRVEDTVLDLIDRATSADRVVSLITGSCQRRLSTARRLGQAAAGRGRLRWRGLVDEVLDDVRDGVQSPLERRWRNDVERAHGLPPGQRNHAEKVRGSRLYRDVHYVKYRTVAELDGNAAHPTEHRELDRARDNDAVEIAQVTLRYGWRAVAGNPCLTAAQVGRVLASRGWRGQVTRCGPGCSISVEQATG